MKAKIYAILGTILVGGLAGWIISSPYSDGFRVGTIIKFSHNGWVCKTWEGDLALGTSAYIGSGSYQGWPFSVKDDQIVKQIEDAVSAGHPVRLHYSQYRFRMPTVSDSFVPCRTDSEYVITGVDKVQ